MDLLEQASQAPLHGPRPCRRHGFHNPRSARMRARRPRQQAHLSALDNRFSSRLHSLDQRALDFELDVFSSAFPTFDEAFLDLFPPIERNSPNSTRLRLAL